MEELLNESGAEIRYLRWGSVHGAFACAGAIHIRPGMISYPMPSHTASDDSGGRHRRRHAEMVGATGLEWDRRHCRSSEDLTFGKLLPS
jgi:hypothetical protein